MACDWAEANCTKLSAISSDWWARRLIFWCSSASLIWPGNSLYISSKVMIEDWGERKSCEIKRSAWSRCCWALCSSVRSTSISSQPAGAGARKASASSSQGCSSRSNTSHSAGSARSCSALAKDSTWPESLMRMPLSADWIAIRPWLGIPRFCR